MINATKLDQELKVAGIQFSGVNSLGVVWDMEGNEIQDRPDILVILQVHDPVDYITPIRETLQAEAPMLLRNIPNWVTWDTQQVTDYINTDVTSLASAKVVLVAMARLLVALRDRAFAEIVAEERQ
ncbi:MAG: hypothetical protein AAGU17_11065 [Anaerolineaceae bacterium]